jgi:O-antigen/teichoic acid export membrane protein
MSQPAAAVPGIPPSGEVLEEPIEATEALDGRFDFEPADLRRQTARGALINSGFQIGFAGLGLLRRVVVAAFLTASQFGVWGLILSTLLTLSWLKQVGVGDKYIQQNEPDQEAAFQKAFTIELVYTLGFYAIVIVALPIYALIYGQSQILLPGFVLSLAFLGSALQTPIWIPYRQMHFVRQRTLEGVDPVVSTVATIALAVAGAGYWSLVIGQVIGTTCGAIAALISCPYPIRWRWDSATVRSYFDFSWPLFLTSASGLVVVQGAVLFGNWSVGLAGVGAIGLAGSFSIFADRVDQLIRATIYPAVCAVQERTSTLFEVFVKSNRLALMWGMPFGIGLALFGPDLVTYVLGSKWEGTDVTELLQAFGLIVAFRQVAFNWSVFFSARGETRPMAINGGLALIAFFAVAVPLMFAFGIKGYAAGMAAVLAVELCVRTWFVTRLFEGFRIGRHLIRAMAPSVPAVGAVLIVRAIVDAPRTGAMAAGELGLYILVTVLATLYFERNLISELRGYMRRRSSPAPVPAT